MLDIVKKAISKYSGKTLADILLPHFPAQITHVQIAHHGDDSPVSQLDGCSVEEWIIVGGKYHGHQYTEETSKHNCGAVYKDVDCSCGQYDRNEVNGCWQHDHQREGESTLEDGHMKGERCYL